MEDKHPLEYFRGAVTTIVVIILALTANYFVNEARESRVLTLSNWYAPPEVSLVDGSAFESISPGESFILTYHVERQPLHCWAVWVDMMDGPVSHQFPPERSQILVNQVTKVDIHKVKQVPHNLPEGTYRLKQIAFPTCRGRDLPPFIHDTGIDIEVN